MAKNKVGANYTAIKIHKHSFINILKPEKIAEIIRSLPSGWAETFTITERPVLDGCSIKATALNGKIANYSVWYNGSTEYVDNPRYLNADESTKLDMSPYVLNKSVKEEDTEMYRFSTLEEAVSALAEFAPDW